MKPRTKILAAAAALALAGVCAVAIPVSAGDNRPQTSAPAAAARQWDAATVDICARLPVQDGGRVKPLSTFAGFTLLALNGKRSVATPDGVNLDATRWLLDCIFFPDDAVRYRAFVIEDAAVLDAAGVAHEGRNRRDRYSYSELATARERIYDLASQYAQLDEKQRNVDQGQLINLAHNMQQFESVAGLLGVACQPPHAGDSPALAAIFGKNAEPRLPEMLGRADELSKWLVAAEASPHDTMDGGTRDAFLKGWIEDVKSASHGVALLPPPGTAAERSEWLSPAELVTQSLFHHDRMPDQVAAFAELDAMYAARQDAVSFRTHAQAFSDRVLTMAKTRGEYGHIPLEVTFYRLDLFTWAQVVFVLGFVVAAFSWIKPGGKWLPRLTTVNVLLATGFLVTGITMRCIIRERPPVSTLYESILFVTAVGAIALMVGETFSRRGIALALATLAGAGGLFLANRYEVQEHIDTMPSLVAVLDTNFWLASHVTTVTIGYSAGLLAGLVGHVYVLGKVFGLKKKDAGFYKTLTTMTYGMLCFGLLFSVLGTVLGGIWANESWGRFWGWDPKENGALTIVLWELIVLHARRAGYVRDFGVAMASVFGAAVVASSWWGVNLLNVGLHSYGFTSGILYALLVFYGVEALVLLAGAAHLSFRGAPEAAASAVLPPVETLKGGVR